ncbi:MAG: fibronectin type III domain-containing protein, partial [Bacteroidales bacterium]|nr:fibronectin type III domain-containing protein [Bacteroidales bacterium]
MRQMHSFPAHKYTGNPTAAERSAEMRTEKQSFMRSVTLHFRTVVIALVLMMFLSVTLSGQVATLRNWTTLFNGSGATEKIFNYSIPDGSNTNRILIIAVASTRTPAGTIEFTLTYGGQPLTEVNGDMGISAIPHTALFYLDEAGLDAATDSALVVSPMIPSGVIRNTSLFAAVFDYVNQEDPFTDNQTKNSGTSNVTTFAFTTALAINSYNQAVEIVSSYSSTDPPNSTTYATDWTLIQERTATYLSGGSSYTMINGITNRSIPLTEISDVTSTSFKYPARASMTALSLNYEPPPPPTIQASDIIFTDVTSSSMTISWTNGDGTNRIVLIKAGDPVDSDPEYGTTYTASNIFGNGSELGTGNFVVYNGTGNSVTVLNLDAKTTYHVAIYEFSGPPGMEFYLEEPARGSQMTGPETAVTDDYRSNGSGDWETAEIWQTFDGEIWVTAGTAPNSLSGTITIRYGHEITVTSNLTVDQVMITGSGQVTINPGVTLTIADGDDDIDFFVRGTLINGGAITATGILGFDSGSVYQHTANGGAIPATVWDANSLCSVTGVTSNTLAGIGQNFGNFTWNSPDQTSVIPINADVTVNGNFLLTSTGSGKLILTGTADTRTLTITGNFRQTGGTLDLSSGSATGYLIVAGNFLFTGGTITESSSGRGSIIFNGNGSMQNFTSGGTFSNMIDFTVNSGAYLQLGTESNTSFITGSSGNFTLTAGATLGVTDRYGITTINGDYGGNIQVSGTRHFDENAFYIYNGPTPQNTGNGLPLIVRSLVLNNTAGAVALNSARTITSFSINTGSKANLGTLFIHNTSMLILGGVGQLPGTYGHPASDAEFLDDIFFVRATGVVNNSPLAGTWLGITTDWNTGTNWIGGVPTSATDAKIFSFTANQPLISSMPTAVSNSVTINTGASLTIGPAGSATLTSLINDGTLNLGSDATGIASLIVDDYSGNGIENIQMYLTGGGNESNYPYHYISSPVQSLSADV